MGTPRSEGFFMAPDWAPGQRYWMAWPDQATFGADLGIARQASADLASSFADLAPVTMLANPTDVVDVSLHCGPGVGTMVMPHAGCAMRALGPTFLMDKEGGAAGLHWQGDTTVARIMLDHLSLPHFEAPLPPLGVAVDVDGQGTCLACESLSRATDQEGRPIEFLLADFLGIEKVIWLPEGRVRRRARFLRPGLVLAETDPDVLASLATTDARGRKLEVITVPVPKRRDSSGLPVSYVDCVVADRVVVLPAFEEGRDEAALAGITSALPDLRVFSFPAMDHAHGRCSLSGLVLSQPRGYPSKPAS